MTLREEKDRAIYSRLVKKETGIDGLLAYANFKKEEFDFFSEYSGKEIKEEVIEAFYKTYNDSRIKKLLDDAHEQFVILVVKANAQISVTNLQDTIEDIQQSISDIQNRQRNSWLIGVVASLIATLVYTLIAFYLKDFILLILKQL